jgi:hypothetical protein
VIRNDLTPDVMQDFDELDEPRNQARLFPYPLRKLPLTASCAVSADTVNLGDVAE